LFQGRNIYLGVSDGLFTASIFAGAEPAADNLHNITVLKLSNCSTVRKFWKTVRESCNPVPGGLQEVFVL
jgi:hypothetical protein